MKLNNRFFELTTEKYQDRVLYEAYKCVYVRSTMVLFSRKTKTPLAALTLKAEDVGCLGMFTGRPSPDGDNSTPYFQGMLNMSDQVFDFTITNLSNEGMINFNILHTRHLVSEVDPGPRYGVNQLNELFPNQSYTIEADQRTNCKMILAGKTQLTHVARNTMAITDVTVRESEAGDEKSGLYFYLSVVPEKTCQELLLKFEEGTVWKVVPGFVRRVRRPQNPNNHFFLQQLHHDSGASSLPNDTAPAAMRNQLASHHANFARCCYNGRNQHRLRPDPDGRIPRENAQDTTSLTVMSMSSNQYFEPVDVGNTQAAELRYGKQRRVVTYCTGRDYAYDCSSEPTVLCMSIWKDMRFLPLSNIEKELKEEVDEWIRHEGKRIIHSLNAVYKSDVCVIDLESKADTIICPCGHQCINHTNTAGLKACPLCRCTISSFVRADGPMSFKKNFF